MKLVKLYPRNILLIMALCIAFTIPLGSTLAQSQDNGKVKILALGDSITHAEINRASYRYPLWKKLIDAEIEFDFVGSMNTQLSTYSKGTPPQPDYRGQLFDPDHEGHFGWQASDIAYGRNPNNNTGSGSLSQWLQTYDFDMALIHLGTNDVFYRQSNSRITGELKDVIKALRKDNPKAIILLATLIPTTKKEAYRQGVESLNAVIPSLVSQMNTRASPVLLVDQFADFDVQTETYDGIHPNALGEEKMAPRWFEAIIAVLPLMQSD
ncbi:MAG: cellulose-binding protein [Proteobacteria bacterium]|nr:cellulose-binding protein [Pseudomonadota bacterium]